MAARYLCTHDYTILARNYRTPFGEVDLIAQKDGVLVYVEVKYRSSNDYGDPLEAVDRRKQRQICKVANYHYAGYAAGQEMDCRFDVIAYTGTGTVSGQKGTGASAFVFSPSFGTYGRKELFYHQRGWMQHRNVSESESEFYTWR